MSSATFDSATNLPASNASSASPQSNAQRPSKAQIEITSVQNAAKDSAQVSTKDSASNAANNAISIDAKVEPALSKSIKGAQMGDELKTIESDKPAGDKVEPANDKSDRVSTANTAGEESETANDKVKSVENAEPADCKSESAQDKPELAKDKLENAMVNFESSGDKDTSAIEQAQAVVIPEINAKVGTIEVDGQHIEMLSLAQLREQTLAQEKAIAEAKKAKRAASRAASAAKRAENASTRPRKLRTNKTKTKTKSEPKQTEQSQILADAALGENGEATVVPETLDALSGLKSGQVTANFAPSSHTKPHAQDQSKIQSQDKAQDADAIEGHGESAGKNEPASKAEDVAENAPESKPESEDVAEKVAESGTEPTLAQSLLNKLIANVEQLETQASQVADDAVSKEAAAAVKKAQKSNELTLNPNVTPNIVDDPQWDDVEEMSPEQIEKYSQMGLQEGDVCPVCSNGLLMLRHSYKSDFLGCSNYPNCKFHLFTGKRSAVVTLKELSSLCPICHGNLEVKKGRFGIFIGCSNYPECNYVYHRKDETPHVQITCPVCKQGHLVERRGRSGKSFYGCDNFPNCNFSVFGVPVEVICKECGFPVMYKKKVKNGTALICGDPKCPSRKKRKRQMLE